jgi:DNA polymerase-3 subunit delta'
VFENIIGHSVAKKILTNAIEKDKISHAYIFYGICGIGKFLTAQTFAQSLICENKNACGICHNCKQFSTNADIKILDLSKNKDGETKGSISVEDARTIASDIYIKPFSFDKKIYIIDNADKMTVAAQNALLKVFEEPPSYAVIILVAHNITDILPTILSRGVLVKFSPLSQKLMKEYFDKNDEKRNFEYAISNSNGSIKNAIEILNDENYFAIRQEIFIHFTNMLKTQNKSNITKLYAIFIKNEDSCDKILDILSSIVYDIVNIGNTSLIKNSDFNYPKELKLSLKKSLLIFEILKNLSKKLNSNAAYNLSVFASLLEIHSVII